MYFVHKLSFSLFCIEYMVFDWTFCLNCIYDASLPLEKRSCGVDDRHLNWLDLRESHHHVQVICRKCHSIAVTLAPIFNMVNLIRNFFFLNMLLVLLWFFKIGFGSPLSWKAQPHAYIIYERKIIHREVFLGGGVIESKPQSIYREILCNTLHEPIRPIVKPDI